MAKCDSPEYYQWAETMYFVIHCRVASSICTYQMMSKPSVSDKNVTNAYREQRLIEHVCWSTGSYFIQSFQEFLKHVETKLWSLYVI